MQENFILFLHANDLQHPSWVVLNADHTIRQISLHDEIEGLAQIADGKRVIVVVPAEDVLLTSVVLPKMNRTRLLQALPYALEERLIDDVDTLHFSVQQNIHDETLATAIVAHSKMAEWLALLNTWHISVDEMIPAPLTLPLPDNTWQLVLLDQAIFRTDLYSGFAAEPANLLAYLQIALNDALKKPEKIILHNSTSHAYQAAIAEMIPCEEEFLSKEELLSLCARHALDTSHINLLQNQYAVKKSRLPQIGKVWRMATYLLAAWVALLFLYPLMSNAILSSRAEATEAEITAIYKRNFPDAHSVIAPKIRMQDKLDRLAKEMGDNPILLLLANIGKALQVANNVRLQRLDFQNNQLTLELTAATSDDFSAFTDYLTQQGFSVKQQNATLNGSRINATLQIDRG